MHHKKKSLTCPEKAYPPWIWLLTILPGIIHLGFSAIFIADDNLMAKIVAVLCLILVLGIAFYRREQFARGNMVFIVVSLFVLFTGLSTLDASSGKFAISEFIKMLAAFSLFLVVYIVVAKKNVVKFLLHALTNSAALICLLTLDGVTFRIFTPTLNLLLFGDATINNAVYDGTRLWGFWGNPNVMTTILGLNLFLSYYLYLKATKKWQRGLQSFYMVMMAYEVMMCMSLGGIASLGMSVIGFLILAEKGERLHHGARIAAIFILAVVTQMATLDSYTTNFPSGSMQPFCGIVIATVVFYYAEPWLTKGVDSLLSKPKRVLRLIPPAIGGMVALLVVLVFTLQHSAQVTDTSPIYRIIYPAEGTYTLTVDLGSESESVWLKIDTPDINKVLNIDTSWPWEVALSEGESLTIEITEDTAYFRVSVYGMDATGATFNDLILTGADGETYTIPLAYTLAPETMVQRLQGLRYNASMLHRLQFVEDCWTLLLEKPLLGHGAGGFEYGAQRVQPFRYVATDPHNQFLQVMVEGGIVGLILYIGLYVVCFYVLFKTRKRNELSLFLSGSLLMVLIHGFNEYSMSDINCMLFAYTLLAMVAGTADTGQLRQIPYKEKVSAGILLPLFLLCIPITGNIIANYRMATQTLSFELLQSNALIDIYEKNDYKISYVLGPTGADEEAQVQQYLKELKEVKSNYLGIYLAEYYMGLGDYENGYYYLTDFIDAAPLNEEYWETAFNLCLSDGSIEAIEILYQLATRMVEMNETAISPVYLSAEVLQGIQTAFSNQA